ncbi:MAG: NADH-quinone oxidoreductase subunit I [Ignavibacteriaceae bacterium]
MKEYLNNIWMGLSTVFIGMKVTFKHLFVPAVTIQYPDEKLTLPQRERNRLYVNMDDCIGCDQCARACPVDCITIETVKSLPTEDLGKTSNGKKKVLWVTQFDIDIAKCCYCQLCVFPCPTECIYMTDVYEFSEYERGNLLYNYITLTPQEVAEKKDNFAKLEIEKAAQKAKAAAEAAKKKAEAAANPEIKKPVPKPVDKKEAGTEKPNDSANTGNDSKENTSNTKQDKSQEESKN